MKLLLRGLVLGVLAAALSLSAGEKPGNKGDGPGPGGKRGAPEFDFILDHAKDLNLTPDQTRRIKELKEKVESKREAVMKSPENRELYKELMAARKSGDEEKLKDLREKVKEQMAKSGGGGEDLKDQLMQILQPDQLAKLKEIRESEGGGMKKGERGPGGKAPEGKKPDPSKGTPKLFEDEK
jgi:Spy/CpxP family protein refolding chaperone